MKQTPPRKAALILTPCSAFHAIQEDLIQSYFNPLNAVTPDFHKIFNTVRILGGVPDLSDGFGLDLLTDNSELYR